MPSVHSNENTRPAKRHKAVSVDGAPQSCPICLEVLDAASKELIKLQCTREPGSLPGSRLCFVNATEVGLKNHDWLEIQNISLQCDAVMVVAVKCQAEALVKVPFLCAPEESTARPRANLNKLQRQQEGGRRLLEQERKTILDTINDPVWQDKTRLRKLDRMRELVDQLEGIRRKNPAEPPGALLDVR